jgi:hypothetical protein
MNTVKREGQCWPTRQQELLLRASLLKGDEAIDAWHEWKSKVDVDLLDYVSLQLLPLLYRNLLIHNIADPSMDKFKGIYRLNWYKNQMLLHDMTTVLHAFHNANIKTMILKGAALTLIHYKDHGLRYMEDFDVLVETEQASAAVELLKILGWRPKLRSLKAFNKEFNKEYFSVVHSYGFEDSAHRQLDLHWHVFLESSYANSDNDFWNFAVSTDFNSVSTCALNPTDQLLHVCVHGLNWAPVPLLRWIADAVVVINTSKSEIDWNRLVEKSQKHYLTLKISNVLKYLHELLNVFIPSETLQSLQSMHVSRTECFEYKVNTSPSSLMGELAKIWFRYLRFLKPTSHPFSKFNLINFIRFLKHYWDLDYLWQVPFYALARAWKMVTTKS